jgi:hypothetical protein
LGTFTSVPLKKVAISPNFSLHLIIASSEISIPIKVALGYAFLYKGKASPRPQPKSRIVPEKSLPIPKCLI